VQRRYLELDSMRGLAALMVVVYHYSTWHEQSLGYSSTTPLFNFWQGSLGVELFFMISGFVIFMTIGNKTSITDFAISRFARLFPAYWVAVIFTSILLLLAPIPGREITLVQAAVNLSMLQKWLGVPSIDGVYWTLAVELSFYFLIGLCALTNQLKNIVVWSACLLGAAILVWAAETYLALTTSNAIKHTFLLEYGNLFVAGIMFYLLILHRHGYRYHAIIGISLLVEALLRPEAAPIVSAFYVMFYLLYSNKIGFLQQKYLIYLGNISYSLYLIHQNFGYVVIDIMEQYGLANSISVLIAPCVLSILISSLMYEYVERPGIKFFKRFRAGVKQSGVQCS